MSFQIPKRRVQPVSENKPSCSSCIDQSDEIEHLIESLPHEFILDVKSEFQGYDTKHKIKTMKTQTRVTELEREIARIQKELLSVQKSLEEEKDDLFVMKKKYVQNDIRTHKKLMRELEDCFNQGKNFAITFECECADRRVQGERKYMNMCPPVKAFFKQLEAQNYTPIHVPEMCQLPCNIEHKITCDLDF
jgi:hypothetical protein